MKRTHRVRKRGVMCAKGHDEWVHYGGSNGWRCVPCHHAAAKQSKTVMRAERPAQFLHETAKARAKKKGLKFTITIDDVKAVWPKDGLCPILGQPLKANTGKGHAGDWSPTLDRINSAWGYEPGNIAVISHKANRAKNTLTAAELQRVAIWMRRMGMH